MVPALTWSAGKDPVARALKSAGEDRRRQANGESVSHADGLVEVVHGISIVGPKSLRMRVALASAKIVGPVEAGVETRGNRRR
jgi:hypothetical protein